MAAKSARGRTGAKVVPIKRLARAQRREDLLDATVRLILSDGIEAVSMETVADRAGVSRPLVYKHFASKHELLIGVYRREALTIYDEVAADVRAATNLPGMYRALVRASIRASSEHGALFAAFRSAGTWNQKLRDEQRARDRETDRVFAEQARNQYGIPLPEARSATVILLAAIDAVLAQWRTRRSPAEQLEETYMDIVMGGLRRLAARTAGQSAVVSS